MTGLIFESEHISGHTSFGYKSPVLLETDFVQFKRMVVLSSSEYLKEDGQIYHGKDLRTIKGIRL